VHSSWIRYGFPLEQFRKKKQNFAVQLHVFTNLVGVEQHRTRRRTTTTVAAEIKNFNKTRPGGAAALRQLRVLEHVTFQ